MTGERLAELLNNGITHAEEILLAADTKVMQWCPPRPEIKAQGFRTLARAMAHVERVDKEERKVRQANVAKAVKVTDETNNI